jgi:hypothetical protein
MGIYKNKNQEKTEVVASVKFHAKNTGSVKLTDNFPGKTVQRELQEIVNNSLKVQQLRSIQAMVDNKQKNSYRSFPAIQRMVDWREEEVETKNPVNVVMPPFDDWGFTHFIINGSENVAKAMNPPEISVEKNTIGVSISVAKVPINNLGTRMEIPIPPPWNTIVPKKKVGDLFYSEASKYFDTDLTPYQEGDGNTTLRVKGIPSDSTMVFHTQDHEQHHVNDDVKAREQIVDPWDDALYNMKRAGTKFWGINQNSAMEKLYKAAGGTPKEIGDRYFERVKQLGKNYHLTKEGMKPPLSGINTSMDQSSIELFYKPH